MDDGPRRNGVDVTKKTRGRFAAHWRLSITKLGYVIGVHRNR